MSLKDPTLQDFREAIFQASSSSQNVESWQNLGEQKTEYYHCLCTSTYQRHIRTLSSYSRKQILCATNMPWRNFSNFGNKSYLRRAALLRVFLAPILTIFLVTFSFISLLRWVRIPRLTLCLVLSRSIRTLVETVRDTRGIIDVSLQHASTLFSTKFYFQKIMHLPWGFAFHFVCKAWDSEVWEMYSRYRYRTWLETTVRLQLVKRGIFMLTLGTLKSGWGGRKQSNWED